MSNNDFDYLGPYHVQAVLGRGGMGSVYKGIHAQSGQVVAIKVIASGIANQSRFRRRFAAEVEALKRLKHPNIVELIGYGEEKGMLFYAMEYVDGKSLHEHLRHRETFSWEEVVQIGIETTAALKHAHNIGIIHRDLKPANLMMSTKGQIKLTDFGISKLFGSGDETAAGSIIGTADYMPPEQAEGKPVNVRSDLYSLGCVMYALLTGAPPFAGKTVPEVLYAVRYNPVPNLATRVSGIPEDLAALIHHLLEKDPLKRPPTALVVGNRLKALQKGMQRKTKVEDKPSEEIEQSSSATEIGPQLTSLDLSDVDDDELKLTGAEESELGLTPEASDTRRGEGFGTHDQQTMLAPESGDKTANESPTQTSVSQDASHVSQQHVTGPGELSVGGTGQFHSFASEEAQLSSGGPSHFTPVSEQNSTKFAFSKDEPPSPPTIDWIHYGSIAGMVILLLGSVLIGWWMLQPDSADELYATINAAVESGDDGQLISAGGSLEEFLTRFPDDSRHAEVQALADEAELIRRAKLLQRKATRGGGVNELSAIEQAFLECLQARSSNAAVAKQKLNAFITVFGQMENLERSDQRLVELARFALRIGEGVAVAPEPPAKLQLEKLIQAADKALKGPALKNYYRNLLLLYQDKPWASEQMRRIQMKLETESEG